MLMLLACVRIRLHAVRAVGARQRGARRRAAHPHRPGADLRPTRRARFRRCYATRSGRSSAAAASFTRRRSLTTGPLRRRRSIPRRPATPRAITSAPGSTPGTQGQILVVTVYVQLSLLHAMDRQPGRRQYQFGAHDVYRRLSERALLMPHAQSNLRPFRSSVAPGRTGAARQPRDRRDRIRLRPAADAADDPGAL